MPGSSADARCGASTATTVCRPAGTCGIPALSLAVGVRASTSIDCAARSCVGAISARRLLPILAPAAFP